MLFRLRRYRLLLALAVFALVGLFYLKDLRPWASPLYSAAIPSFNPHSAAADDVAIIKPAKDDLVPTKEEDQLDHLQKDHLPPADAPPAGFPQINLPGTRPQDSELAQDTDNVPKLKSLGTATKDPAPALDSLQTIAAIEPSYTPEVIHWTRFPEMYPVASTIQLPAGKPSPIPKIQATFKEEDPAHAKTRKDRRRAVKEAMRRHWGGYKKFAWRHDELKPVSGGFKDPFAGWGATLVDSLDTLWIMDLHNEFEEAVVAVADIDFTTTSLKEELPLFEVTIRYLGGLLSAYDVAGQKHQILLDKAVELADVLFGAFDTENRMPITYYRWKPNQVPLHHRAGPAVVLAELGTLSMEFTRLAQLTGEAKYYDAIARITNELEAFQNHTKLPGLWPLYIDATGCQSKTPVTGSAPNVAGKAPNKSLPDSGLDTTDASSPSSAADAQLGMAGEANLLSQMNTLAYESVEAEATVPTDADFGMADEARLLKDMSTTGEAENAAQNSVPKVLANYGHKDRAPFEKRAEGATSTSSSDKVECIGVGLKSASYSQEAFTLGGMADSVYEYLPKEYILLGGLNKQYKQMHETAMTAIKEYVLYRPMLPDEKRELRFTGTFRTKGTELPNGRIDGTLEEKTGHLSCFIGAVVGLGAKVFNRPDEMSLAEQLADGCVWAYESTLSGIMSEDIYPVVCDDMKSCPWNETAWWEAIDPNARQRIELEHKEYEKSKQRAAEALLPSADASERDAGEDEEEGEEEDKGERVEAQDERALPRPGLLPRAPPPIPKVEVAVADDEARPKSYEEYMRERVKLWGLAPGITRWGPSQYILRPEAIESVFYMYRMTGDTKWQDKGWKMWQAIDKHTRTEFGNSAIRGVTEKEPWKDDAAESFWTGETLKYFYLLFSEPELISLDDFVLNTEAHPFIRPDGRLKSGAAKAKGGPKAASSKEGLLP